MGSDDFGVGVPLGLGLPKKSSLPVGFGFSFTAAGDAFCTGSGALAFGESFVGAVELEGVGLTSTRLMGLRAPWDDPSVLPSFLRSSILIELSSSRTDTLALPIPEIWWGVRYNGKSQNT